MRSTKRPLITIAAPILALGLILAACSSDDSSTETSDSSTASGSGTAGGVNISGSSTVEPISSRVAELFEEAGNSADVTVDGPGTSDGFKAFCAGETDISDASRPISAKEVAECEAGGVEFIELEIGFDGLTVITNPANDTVECLSFADLYALAGPESEGFGRLERRPGAGRPNWARAPTFPSAPLDITAPGTESGTYDSFIELALDGHRRGTSSRKARSPRSRPRSPVPTTPPRRTTTPSSQAIEGSDSSFGWVGFAFAEEAGDQVKEIAISEEPGGECIAPSAETIADGTYPLSRSLYIYVNKAKADSNSTLSDYVDFYLGDGYVAVEEVGYVPLPDSELSATKEIWSNQTIGTRDGGK